MRRIIERVVTVVTTTTWKISWEPDPPHTEPATDSISNELPGPNLLIDIAQSAQTISPMIESKEVDPPKIVKTTDQLADESPQ